MTPKPHHTRTLAYGVKELRDCLVGWWERPCRSRAHFVARAINELAEAGNPVALEVILRGANALIKGAVAMINQLGNTSPLIGLCGCVALGSQIAQKRFCEVVGLLYPRARIEPADHAPAKGAYLSSLVSSPISNWSKQVFAPRQENVFRQECRKGSRCERDMVRVTIWNEYLHELENEAVAKIYPEGIHAVIADFLKKEGDISVRTATLNEPEHGLTEEVLAETDVLIWWGHKAHWQVSDSVVERVYQRVLAGMGLIVLHSGHFSKIFRRMMGTSCDLRWRDVGRRPAVGSRAGHPIAQGLGLF